MGFLRRARLWQTTAPGGKLRKCKVGLISEDVDDIASSTVQRQQP